MGNDRQGGMRSLVVAFVLFVSSACGELHDDDHVHPDDVIDGHNAAQLMQGQAQSGRWTIPAEVMAIGDQQDVAFNNAPAYDGGANCTGGATQGALALRDQLIGFFPQIASVGIYNCRVIAGSNSMSLHGVGRALDIMMPTVGGDADNDLGDPIAHYLIENAELIGIQTIIWDHTIWRVSNSPRQHEYTGSNPHVDHLHVEINLESAALGTPFFDNPTGPVACEGLSPVTADGVVVDNGDSCFQLFGPAQFWRQEATGGQGGLAWTNAFENDTASNWARWSLPLEAPGTFEVQVFIDPSYAVFANTHYEITAAGTAHPVDIDQGNADGWTSLGTFVFNADGTENVIVVDNFAGAVGAEQHVVADALKVRLPPVVPDPVDPVDPGEGEGEGEPSDPTDPADPADPGPVDDDEADDDVRPGIAVVPNNPSAGGCATTPVATCAPLALALLLVTGRRRRTGTDLH